MLQFQDRHGNIESLQVYDGEIVEDVLRRNHIPPASVIVLRNGTPVSEFHRADDGAHYEAALIEGYTIKRIRDEYALARKRSSSAACAYVKHRLALRTDGELQTDVAELDLNQLAQYVEQTVFDTCTEFDLVPTKSEVVLGLSGGVDSSSLLLTLAAMQKVRRDFKIIAVTFEDFDSDKSPTFHHATHLAESLGVEHHLVEAGIAEKTFHLNTPLKQILPRLMETKYAQFAMYIDHHTTRRALEVYCEQNGVSRIALGLHTTDLIAGLLNGLMSGYATADLPLRKIGNFDYIYPLAFVPKRELHLYHLLRVGRLANHASPNGWEQKPVDRNFYYYLADTLQSIWPGLESMMFLAHGRRLRNQNALQFEECSNCGATLVQQSFTIAHRSECDACVILREAGFIESAVSEVNA